MHGQQNVKIWYMSLRKFKVSYNYAHTICVAVCLACIYIHFPVQLMLLLENGPLRAETCCNVDIIYTIRELSQIDCICWSHLFDMFVNYNWVDTRWHYYSTHAHKNNT